MTRGLKFRIWKVEGLYYLCSENKGADQLHGNREADLRLCFRICKMLVLLITRLKCNFLLNFYAGLIVVVQQFLSDLI